MIKSNKPAIPLSILTGFLGSGKTTLLNRLLNEDQGLRIGVLVNDFGKINIDAELVVGVENNLISLANGCICCSIRDDLIDSVIRLTEQPKPIDYIIIEASGIADPQNILLTFIEAKLREHFRLDSIVCVVDSDQFFSHLDVPGILDLKIRQIGVSDIVVLNKTDIASEAQVQTIKSWLSQHIQRVRIIETTYCKVPYEILLGTNRRIDSFFTPKNIKEQGVHTANEFSSWSYESERPFSLDSLKEMVKRRLPGTIYRCKGIIYAADAPDRRVVLQAVGRRADLELFDEWKDRTPRTQIVVIGAPGSIDERALQQDFDECTMILKPKT